MGAQNLIDLAKDIRLDQICDLSADGCVEIERVDNGFCLVRIHVVSNDTHHSKKPLEFICSWQNFQRIQTAFIKTTSDRYEAQRKAEIKANAAKRAADSGRIDR